MVCNCRYDLSSDNERSNVLVAPTAGIIRNKS